MKAVGYLEPGALTREDSLIEINLPTPEIGPTDLLVQINAVSVNPVDYKIRSSRKAQNGQPVVLGWDAAGIVTGVGDEVTGFSSGDEVYYAGDLNRQGSNAEYQSVDYRLVGRKPKKLSFAQAAAMPLTGLTAYEALFERLKLPHDEDFALLLIGGAGGVGSTAVQLVKALTQGRVFPTSGRYSSREWLLSLNPDGILDRKRPLTEELERLGLPYFDYVFSTTHTDDYLKQIGAVIRPFGAICLIDDPATLDITPLKSKAISVAWELMFTKSLYHYDMESQGAILDRLATLIDEGQIRSTAAIILKGLTAANFKEAHRQLEEQTAIGKIVIEF